MAGLKHISAEELAILQKSLGLKLPPDFIRFAATHPLPDLKYMEDDDLDELCGLNAARLIAFNENLRDPALNPEGKNIWQEHYFAIGSRALGDAVYYLDTQQKSGTSSVYALEAGAPSGQLIAGDFTRWAATMLGALAQEDERIRQWHEKQQPRWWRWVTGIIRK